MFRRLLYAVLMLSMPLLTARCYICPVEAADGLIILPTDSGYLNDYSFYYVVGEVQNAGNTSVADVYVNATFYNSTGELIAEISQPTKLSTILPGRTSPFDITLYSTVESLKVHNYTLHVAKFSTTQNGQTGLMITPNSSSFDSNGFHINGKIENVGTQNVTFTRVIATFYNTTGIQVLAIAAVTNYSHPDSLNVNQTAQFEIVLSTSEASKVDHYTLEAEAYDPNFVADYETIPELQLTPLILTLLTLTVTIITTKKRLLNKKQCVQAKNITEKQECTRNADAFSTAANLIYLLSFSCPLASLCNPLRFPMRISKSTRQKPSEHPASA